MTHSLAHGAGMNSTATATANTAMDEGATPALDAIRNTRPADLEACIRAMADRWDFFFRHGAELAQAALRDHSGDCLAVLLKMGMHSNTEWIHRISVDGNARQQQILREYTDKSDMVKRWTRESSQFCQKFRYQIRSIF